MSFSCYIKQRIREEDLYSFMGIKEPKNGFEAALGGYTYVIPRVSREEATYLLGLAKKYNIDECLSEMLKEDNWDYLTNVCVSASDIGRHLMTMILYYDIDRIKTGFIRRVDSIEDIKKFEEKAKFYGDFEFLKANNYQNYSKYVDSLDVNNLKKEWYFVDEILYRNENNYMTVLNELVLLKRKVKRLVESKNEVTKIGLYICLDDLFEIYKNAETRFNDLSFIKVEGEKELNDEDRNELCQRYIDFHNENKHFEASVSTNFYHDGGNKLIRLLQLIRDIFNLFNSRTRVRESHISLVRYNYLAFIPDAYLGITKTPELNYRAILEKFYFYLSFND